MKSLAILLTAVLSFALPSCAAAPLTPAVDIESPRPMPTLKFDPSAEGRKVAVIDFTAAVEYPEVEVFEVLLDSAGGADEIVIVMTTPGGNVTAALDMIDLIRRARAPVTCVARGLVASAGFHIFQQCPTRVMEVQATLMVHDAKWVTPPPGILGEVFAAPLLERMNQSIAVMQCRRLKFPTVEKCREHYRGRDWFMTVHEAIEVGATDRVVFNAQVAIDRLRFPSITP